MIIRMNHPKKLQQKKKKKSTKRNRIVDSDDDLSEESSNSSEQSKEEEESDYELSDSSVDRKKKKKKARKRSSSSDDSDSDQPKQKRKRIRGGGGSESEEEDKEEASPTKGRHEIRKIIKDKNLTQETKEAAASEKARRQRMEERQALYNKAFSLPEGKDQENVSGQLVLDFDTETNEVLVEVHKKLVKKNLNPTKQKGLSLCGMHVLKV